MENNEEAKISEAEVEYDKNENLPIKKIDFRFELALFLILGFLLGVVIKSEAVKRVTIGFNDGAIVSVKQGYDFEKIKQDLAKASEAQDQDAAAAQQQVPSGTQGNTNTGNN
jgi:hypothetical protein